VKNITDPVSGEQVEVPGANGRGLGHLLSRLRAYLILDPLIFLWTGICGAISLSGSLFDRAGRFQHAMARTWSRAILAMSGTPVEVEHAERLQGPCVVAANHISAFDIPVLYAEVPMQFRIVANKPLFKIPFVGWHLRRSGQIPIDRSTMKTTIKTLHVAVEDLKQGLSVVIFPEGGRSPSGRVQPFMNGAFYVAIKAQAPVLPVAIVGAYEVLPMNTYHIMPRPLLMRVGEPIPTAGLTLRDVDMLADRVKAVIEDLYYEKSVVMRPAKTIAATEHAPLA
jgi:1-acyl-sn-glycerol-3-phosphate acyltransferase